MKKIAGIIVVIVTVLLLVLAYFGLFAPVKISEETAGPFWLVYDKYIGEYKNVGPVMDKIYNDLKKDGIVTTKGFGIYYDNPKTVDKDKLRSIVGCILDSKDEIKIDEIGKKYNLKQYPASKSAICNFPFKGMPSIIIGLIKVYPKLTKHMNDCKYPEMPIMEIYDTPGQVIQYIVPIGLDKKYFDSFLDDIRK